MGSLLAPASAGVASALVEVPPGFEIVPAALPGLVNFPLCGSFDERGRLFLVERSGHNTEAGAASVPDPGRIRLLEDTDGDGVFDHATIFAEQLDSPLGAHWHDGALYVTSAPSVWRLKDTDGDGRADERLAIATGFNSPGNAAALHGPYLHPNGRLYWCHGREGHEVRQNGGGPLVSSGSAARIWSCRLDGSDIQVHAGGGMDNPVSLAFNEQGEMFGTAIGVDGTPRQDGILHWVHGGVYPRADLENVLAEFPRTGALLPIMSRIGPVAPAGMVLPRADAGRPGYALSLYYSEIETRRVIRMTLEREGSTYRGRPEVFASSTSPQIHFADVIEDADGSLLLVDTGTWTPRGMTTPEASQAGSAGAIHRVRRTGMKPTVDPRGATIDWNTADSAILVPLLGDNRFAVRDRAIAALAGRGAEAVPALTAALELPNGLMRSNAVWALTRIGTPGAQTAVRRALLDLDAGVRAVACQSVLITGDPAAATQLVAKLGDDALFVQREAAHALGRLRNPAAVAALGGAAAIPRDPMLTHALIRALIEINAPAETRALLNHREPRARQAASIAISQMTGRALPSGRSAEALGISRQQILQQPPTWFASAKAGLLAERIVALQGMHGGWSNWSNEVGMTRFSEPIEKGNIVHESLDDGATTTQLKILGRVLTAPRDTPLPPEQATRLRTSFQRGFDYLLKAQYPNGGWPHRFPAQGYHAHITFNDNTTYNVIVLLREAVAREAPYAWLDEPRRERAAEAIDRGITCILASQVEIKGEKTVWGAQHDARTLAPAAARTFEPASLCGLESVGLVRLLMDVEDPSPEIIAAIQSAVAWFERSKITGIRVERFPVDGGFDAQVVSDPAAPPLWARFYELRTNRPIFCGRDGIVRYELAEIERERRAGYGWYTGHPHALLEVNYPRWAAKWLKR